MYEEFYHLQAKPFRLSPDPEFYFASRGHNRALAYLRYGLNQSEGFVVITGDPGTGKTTLSQILLKEMGQTDVVVAHLTTTQLESDDLLRMVAASYGLRYEGVEKAGLLKTLEAFLIARSREHKRALLVVDEAQNLPPKSVEELRMLSNLQVGGQALLQIFMLGQAQFRQMLDRPDLEQLRQRVIANYHLSPLAEDECKDYIESRLSHVGWVDDPHITEDAFRVIFNYTGGIPRRINMLCDRVLLFSCLEDKHVIDAQVLQDVTDELQGETSGQPIQASSPEPVTENARQGHSDSMPPLSAEALEEEANNILDSLGQAATVPPEPNSNAPEISEKESNEATKASSPKQTSESSAENIPDASNWNQSVAQARKDPLEEDDGNQRDGRTGNADEAEKLLDKERFKVITGGKKIPEVEVVKSQPPGVDYSAPLPDASGDSDEVILRKVLRLILAFHRSPRSFPGLDDPSQPLPNGLRAVMMLAVSDDESITSLRQIAVMGISPTMLRAAVRFFIRRVLFVEDADDYRILGLSPDASLSDIETHYGLIMRLLRQEKPNEDDSGLKLVGGAYERLCRSELSPGAREPEEKLIQALIEDDGPDLDLSPNAGVDDTGSRRITPVASSPTPEARAADLPRKGSSGSRGTYFLAAIIVIAFLFMADIISIDKISSLINDVLKKTQVLELVKPSARDTSIDAPPATAGSQAAGNVNGGEELDNGTENQSTSQPAEKNNLSQGGVTPESQETSGEDVGSPGGAAQTVKPVNRVSDGSQDGGAVSQAEIDPGELLALQTRAEEAALAQKKAEAEAAKRAEELAALKKAEDERLAKEAESRRLAEENAKAKALELQELKVELERIAEARAQAEAQADLEAKARAEAELRAAQEAEIRLMKEEDARIAEQRRLQAELRARQAEELARQQVLQQQEAELLARQQPLEEQNSDLDFNDEIGDLKEINISQATQVRAAEDSGKLSESELQAILQRFETVYRQGNIDGLLNLLANNVRTNDISSREELRKSYQAVFDETRNRNITFSNFIWDREENYARGNGTYKFLAEVTGSQRTASGNGEVVLQLERQSGKLLITRFYFSNLAPDKSILSSDSPRISKTALDDLTGKFIGAYETGNIDLLMRLFTSDGSSDGRGLNVIRQDYNELFSTTSLRDMNLVGIDWRWLDEGLVEGQGRYDVEVQLADSGEVDSREGIIRLYVQNVNGVPRIKELGFQNNNQ